MLHASGEGEEKRLVVLLIIQVSAVAATNNDIAVESDSEVPGELVDVGAVMALAKLESSHDHPAPGARP